MLLFALLFLLSFSVNSYAAKAKITDLLLTNTQDDLLVYFKVENCFTEDMEEAIMAGIPTTFTFTMELRRERYISDKEEASLEVKHTVKYDNVKRVFYVLCTEKGKQPEQFKDITKAKTAMSDISGVAITPLKQIERNKRYYVRVKAELDKIRVPLNLEYVFFFVSKWDFETDWSRQDFFMD
jgi:hypothetical protein